MKPLKSTLKARTHQNKVRWTLRLISPPDWARVYGLIAKMYFKTSLLALTTVGLLSAFGGVNNNDNEVPIVPPTPPISNIYEHQVLSSINYVATIANAIVCIVLDRSKACNADSVLAYEIETYIAALLAERVSDPLAIEEVISATVEQPNADDLMAQSDWDIVFDGLGFEDPPETPNAENNLSLAPAHLYSSFTLSYGSKGELMTGAIINDPTAAGEPKAIAQVILRNQENEIPQECWNADLSRWINPDDSGYQPKDVTIKGNEIKAFYLGTEVPINIRVEKVATDSQAWSAILSTTPTEYKLSDIDWPKTVYRYFTSQAGKVLCRDQDYISYPMVAASTESLTSANIAATLYPNFHPKDVTVDDVNQRFTIEDLGTYQWQLDEAPDGLPHLRVIEIAPRVPQNLQHYVLPSDYLIVDAEFIEVEIHDPWDYEVFNDHLFIIFDGEANDFNQHIKAHFEQFTAPFMP